MKQHRKLRKENEKKYFEKVKRKPSPTHTPEEIENKEKISSQYLPMISMRGNRWIHIENYRTIADYQCNYVKVTGSGWFLCIEGSQLKIAYFTEDDMLICGNIEQIRFF